MEFSWKICLFSINLFFPLFFTSLWPHVYLLYSLGYNPVILYFLRNYAIFDHWQIFQLVPMYHFVMLPSWFGIIVLALPYFLSLQDALGISWMFSLGPTVSHFFKKPCFLLLEHCIKTPNLDTKCAIFLFLISSLSPLWSEKTLYIISIL